tara:strand:- start:79 stop:450 length:372 start_codon:yes stop_codon:yes gene_type:complete
MGVVKVNNLIVYAYHGCLAEEATIGCEYVINIKAWGKTKGAAKSDSLEDAIDYVLLSDVAVAQMKIRANLLENVVDRIITACFSGCKKITKIKVDVSKLNPPINANAESVSVSVKKKRSKIEQ